MSIEAKVLFICFALAVSCVLVVLAAAAIVCLLQNRRESPVCDPQWIVKDLADMQSDSMMTVKNSLDEEEVDV